MCGWGQCHEFHSVLGWVTFDLWKPRHNNLRPYVCSWVVLFGRHMANIQNVLGRIPCIMRRLSTQCTAQVTIVWFDLICESVHLFKMAMSIISLLWKYFTVAITYAFIIYRETRCRPNTTGPPCSHRAIIRLEAAWRHRLACAGEAACRPTVECYRRWQQTPATVTSLASLHYV